MDAAVNLKNKNRNTYYQIYLYFLFILILLPLLAPIFLKLELNYPAKIIFLIYSFLCHQFDTRSLYIFDYQYAWCARDTGIWFAWFVAAFLVYKNKLNRIKFYYLIIFLLPIALDGGAQTVFTLKNLYPDGSLSPDVEYISNNMFRFITGSFFGFGVGWWFSQHMVCKEFKQHRVNLNDVKLTVLCLALLFLTYFTLIQAWNFTSKVNKPTNVFDSEAKIQAGSFFTRRADGICPTTQTDIFNWDCWK